jgi:hypothetical protein
MAFSTTYQIVHIVDGDNHDFNLIGVPFDILLSLKGYIGLEHQRIMAQMSARSFKEERALQHERHLIHCQETQTNPKQQFIDFPL